MGRRFGSLSEVEFWGYVPDEVPQVVPATPTISYTWLMNRKLCFSATTGADTTYIEVQRRWKGAAEDAWSEMCALVPQGVEKYCEYHPAPHVRRSADFRFRAVNATATSGWTSVVSLDQPPCLTGTYVGSTRCYSNYTGSNSFDGNPWNVSEVYKDDLGRNYAGLDFGEERVVTGLRYMTRYDQQAERSANIVFEVANEADFSDAVAVYVTPSSGFMVKTIYPVTFDQPVTGRYARYRSATGATSFNLSELEFNTTEVPVETPAKPVVMKVEAVEDNVHHTHAKVTWFSGESSAPYAISLMRAISPNGPWSPVGALTSGAGSFDDVTADVLGRTYYYSIAYQYVAEATAAYGPVYATPLSFTPSGWLERDASDPTILAPGCRVVCNGSPWSGSAAGAAKNVFDNSTDTRADIVSPKGCTTSKIGIDFGQDVCIVTTWCAPRKDQLGRFSGLCIYGTQKTADDTDWMADANGVAISASSGGAPGSFYWKEIKSTSSDFYRTVYLGQVNLATESWMCNLSELQFYGYPQNPKAMAVPSELAATVFPNHVALVWTDDAYATGWTVERRQRATDLWTSLGTTAVPGFDDETAALDGTVYQYRVTAVNATEGAASAPLVVTTTPVPGETPWSGTAAFPTDGRDDLYGIRWADTGDLKHFAMTFRFVRGAGATATSFVPVARTALVGGTVARGTFAELPSEGWFRIERLRGVVRLYVKTSANGSWTQIGASSDPALATGSIVVGAEAVGGGNPLAGYSFSDAKLEKTGPGLFVIVQ